MGGVSSCLFSFPLDVLLSTTREYPVLSLLCVPIIAFLCCQWNGRECFFGGHAAKLIEIKPAGIKDRSTMEASPAITANSHLAGSEPGRRAAVVCAPGNSCICICMHVYACIFMDACKPACLPVCLPVCLSGCMDVWMYGCSMMDEWMDRWICVWATRAAFSCAQGQAAPCFHSML